MWYETRCGSCGAVHEFADRLDYISLEDGTETLLRHPGWSTQLDELGMTVEDLERASRRRAVLTLLCRECGAAAPYSESDHPGIADERTRGVSQIECADCSTSGALVVPERQGENGTPWSPGFLLVCPACGDRTSKARFRAIS